MIRDVERALRELESRGEVVKTAKGWVLKGNESPVHRDAVNLGKLGGSKGGSARAKKLTAARRKQIAREAARRRWGP